MNDKFSSKAYWAGKNYLHGRRCGDSSTGGVKEGPSEGQPQWQLWKWHKDEGGGGGKHSSSIEGTTKVEADKGHFEGEMFQMWRDGSLCISVSFEAKG